MCIGRGVVFSGNRYDTYLLLIFTVSFVWDEYYRIH